MSSTPLLSTHRPKYVKTGLGGAGNFHQFTTRMPPPARAKQVPDTRRRSFTIGIGGAGNTRGWKDRTTQTAAQEFSLRVAQKETTATVRRIGIGGSGNIAMPASTMPEVVSSATSSSSSGFWGLGSADALKAKLTAKFHRRPSLTSLYASSQRSARSESILLEEK